MQRAVVVAACLLALAAGASAAGYTCIKDKYLAQCEQGHLKLEFMAPRGSTDKIATCLTSMRVDLDTQCSVTITSLSSRGSLVNSLWAADTAYDAQNFVECPDSRPAVNASFGTGTRLEAVRNAVIKALSNYVYGLDQWDEPINPIPVPDLDFFQGKLVVKREQAQNLVYAITEADVSDCDMLLDDDYTPIGEITGCRDLSAHDTDYDVSDLCRSNKDAHGPCPDNTYGVMITDDFAVNSWNEKLDTFKVCGLCPAGTYGYGYGCSTCAAGEFSKIGGVCQKCPRGYYSNAGSSVCIPCPMGTYAGDEGTMECKQCPEDTFSWIAGATACIRCTYGMPELCVDGNCPSGAPTEVDNLRSMQSTHIVDVSAMSARGPQDNKCDLTSAVPDFEIKSLTKCKNWATSMNLAFTVYGDCSIQISPISDPTCSVFTDTVGYQYGAIQQRAYYYWDQRTNNWAIRSLFDTNRGVTKATIMEISNSAGTLNAKWFPVTIDANEAYDNAMIRDKPGPEAPEVCIATMKVLGGNVLGTGNVPTNFVQSGGNSVPTVTPGTWTCPPGSFYHEDEICPFCPVGFYCPGNMGTGPATRIPCSPNTFNDMYGRSTTCVTCPSNEKYTSYAAAQQCAVDKVDLLCADDRSKSQAYDTAAQACLPCPAGTQRIYTGIGASTECQDCPPGTSSKEGKFCEACPPGEYSPSPGLANQEGTLGTQCVACPIGSIGLTSGVAQEGTSAAVGATFCDACPPGTWLEFQDAECAQCPPNTYRAGDATPENNVCKPVPAGYRLKDTTHTALELCEKGSVSYYPNSNSNDSPNPAERIPAVDTTCASCSELAASDALRWSHTYAPRQGMTQCIACPAGTKPKVEANGRTSSCEPCPDGSYRGTTDYVPNCIPCGPGYEVGPSSKMECNQCRPGTFLDGSMVTQKKNTCAPCDKNQYRPTTGATSCLVCPRGTQTSDKGNVECTNCPIGYYSSAPGTDCKASPAGTFVNVTAAWVTTPCPKGSWNNELAQDNCNPCAPGKYSNTLGAKECKTCPAGTYSAGQASGCIDCRPGYFAPAGAAACAPCKPGTFAPITKSATCRLCPKGYQCPTNAMQKEGACPRGTFSNKEGSRLCSPCPINTMSQGGGVGAGAGCSTLDPCAVMACIKCPPGTNTRGLVGQSRCQVIRPQVRRLGF